MGTILGLIVLALDIIAIIDCAKSPRTMSKKVIWIILILVLPLIGMIVYFVRSKGKKAA